MSQFLAARSNLCNLCNLRFFLFLYFFNQFVERLFRELHHLMALGPRIQTAVHQGGGDDVRPVGEGSTEVVDATAAVNHAHTFAHQFLLRIGGAEIVELLAPLVDLVAEVHLDGTDSLARQTECAGTDIAAVSLRVAQHAEVDADGTGDEVTVRVSTAAPIDGTGVHARTAADALQALPMVWIAYPL